MQPSSSAGDLAELIKKAIDDQQLTNAEYDKILALAHADGHVDLQERALLRELQELIQDGSVRKVP